MFFIENPNLPDRPAALAIVDNRISDASSRSLERFGVKLLRILAHGALYGAVCSHPDMLLHHIGGNLIVHAPGTDAGLLSALRYCGFSLLQGKTELTGSYPGDIAYNVARVGKYYFHNLRYTDPVIVNQMERLGIEPVHIEQGYAKCSILPVDERSIVTTDAGIAKVAEKKGFDVLMLECGSSIRLDGLNYGFIGGACAMISNTDCAVNGSLSKLDDSEKLVSFLSKKQINIKELSNYDVTDIGSIIPLMVS